MTPLELAQAAKRLAADLGFAACGITDLRRSPTAAYLDQWLERGYHGEMRYLARQAPVRREPSLVWEQAKSVVVVLHNYYSTNSASIGQGYSVSKYAQNIDYHTVTRSLLASLGSGLIALTDHGSYKVYVDAGPLPERELAQRAGLGWLAKNTMLIHPRLGSFTFIGCLLTDLELAPDAPYEADRCGSCSRCLEACPTGAFPEPHVLDATRCVSYLTIEARGEIPEPLRAGVGDNLFGCDICQDVCPWNVRFARETDEPGFRAVDAWPSLDELLGMDQAVFVERFGHTALERAGLGGLQRNARVVAANLRR